MLKESIYLTFKVKAKVRTGDSAGKHIKLLSSLYDAPEVINAMVKAGHRLVELEPNQWS